MERTLTSLLGILNALSVRMPVVQQPNAASRARLLDALRNDVNLGEVPDQIEFSAVIQ